MRVAFTLKSGRRVNNNNNRTRWCTICYTKFIKKTIQKKKNNRKREYNHKVSELGDPYLKDDQKYGQSWMWRKKKKQLEQVDDDGIQKRSICNKKGSAISLNGEVGA
jgi:hypothetical protein